MRLLVCAYEDVDAGRVLVDELSDLDEAVSCCRDLVESEGYPRAEVWIAGGHRLFVVERDGDAVYEGELPDEAALFGSTSPALGALESHVPRGRRAGAGPRPPGHADRPPAPCDGGVMPDAAVPPPSPASGARPAGLLGEEPGSEELWFGL